MSDQQAGWHPDPGGTHEYRYWDGSRWTDDISDGGVAGADPLRTAGSTDPTVAQQPVGDQTAPLPTSPVGTTSWDPTGTAPAAAAGSGGPPKGLIVGLVVLVVVALAVGALLIFGDDDTDGDRASRDADGGAAATVPEDLDPGDLDDFDDFGFDDFGFDAFGDLDGFGFDADSLAEIYQQALGLSRSQAECLADALTSFEDLDEDAGFEAFGEIFSLFARCDIDMSELGGFDQDR